MYTPKFNWSTICCSAAFSARARRGTLCVGTEGDHG